MAVFCVAVLLCFVEYLGDGYGMPSSHSQFMAYFATYMVILMYRRYTCKTPPVFVNWELHI